MAAQSRGRCGEGGRRLFFLLFPSHPPLLGPGPPVLFAAMWGETAWQADILVGHWAVVSLSSFPPARGAALALCSPHPSSQAVFPSELWRTIVNISAWLFLFSWFFLLLHTAFWKAGPTNFYYRRPLTLQTHKGGKVSLREWSFRWELLLVLFWISSGILGLKVQRFQLSW